MALVDASDGIEAPTFDLKVNGVPISGGLRSLIQSVEYESVDGVADVLKIVCADPYDGNGLRQVSEAKIFAPGNEVTVAFGYFGRVIENVGRALIRKVRPFFPQEGMPTLEVTGYTPDVLMMDNEPQPLKERKKQPKKPSKNKKKKVDEFGNEIEESEFKDSKAGRRFDNQIYSDAVTLIAETYGFMPDVDQTPDPPHAFIHKAGMKDYDFVKGLSNITGYYFWVDYDFDKNTYVLHFKNPETYVEPQEKEFNFKYAQGEFSTLLDFEPQMALQDSTTELFVEMQDPITGAVVSVRIEEPEGASPDPIDMRGSPPDPNDETNFPIDLDYDSIDGPYTTDIKIFLGEFSVEIRANRKFNNPTELQAWAQQWFRRQRENFIMGRANLVGVESLRARQIHKLSGVGVAYEGKYTFNRVRHSFSLGGYTCEVDVRKHLDPISPNLRPTTSAEERKASSLALIEDLDLL